MYKIYVCMYMYTYANIYFLNFSLKLILYISLLLFHPAFPPPLFIYDVNFSFPLCCITTPYSYYCSPLYPQKLTFLAVSHLIFIFLF